MPVQTSCPGCGGPIYVEDRAGMAVCQFCGTRFKVNLDGVAPKLAKDTSPVAPEPEPKEDFYSQFQPKAEQEPEPLPEPEPEPFQPPAYTPAPSYQPERTQGDSLRQMFSGRTARVIGLVVGALVIGSCLCLVLAALGVVRIFQP